MGSDQHVHPGRWSVRLRGNVDLTHLFGRVAVQRGPHEEHVGYRSGDGHERADQDLVEDRPALEHAEVQHRADEDESGAERGAHRRRVHALVEALQPEQAQGAAERESRAQHDQDAGGPVHSITSPRSRNFAAAAVETKPRAAMTSAASKYSVVPVRMPKVSTSSMPFT